MGMGWMSGWKTWVGAGLVAAGAIVRYLGYPEVADAMMGFGAALGIVGIGHKIEKSG